MSEKGQSEEGKGYYLWAMNSELFYVQIDPIVINTASIFRASRCAEGRSLTFERTMSLNSRPGLLGKDIPEEQALGMVWQEGGVVERGDMGEQAQCRGIDATSPPPPTNSLPPHPGLSVLPRLSDGP